MTSAKWFLGEIEIDTESKEIPLSLILVWMLEKEIRSLVPQA